MMIFLRSLLFNIYMYGGTLVLSFILILLMPFPPIVMRKGSQLWTSFIMIGLRIVGIRYEIRGLEHLPKGGALVACKHQSAWDTFIFVNQRISTTYVLKKELLRIPFYGWFVWRAQHIAVDRKAGSSALKYMVSSVGKALKSGRNVVIFPEGTRSAPGAKNPYHPGIAAAYSQANVPLIPAALNSGLYWGRASFLKYPGTIILEIMPPIPAGQDRRAMMKTLQETIEAKTAELEAEGRARDFPKAS